MLKNQVTSTGKAVNGTGNGAYSCAETVPADFEQLWQQRLAGSRIERRGGKDVGGFFDRSRAYHHVRRWLRDRMARCEHLITGQEGRRDRAEIWTWMALQNGEDVALPLARSRPQNMGSVQCYCGGDLCVCGDEEITCPMCGGESGFDPFSCDEIDDK